MQQAGLLHSGPLYCEPAVYWPTSVHSTVWYSTWFIYKHFVLPVVSHVEKETVLCCWCLAGKEVWVNSLTVIVINPKRQRGGGAKPAAAQVCRLQLTSLLHQLEVSAGSEARAA